MASVEVLFLFIIVVEMREHSTAYSPNKRATACIIQSMNLSRVNDVWLVNGVNGVAT